MEDKLEHILSNTKYIMRKHKVEVAILMLVYWEDLHILMVYRSGYVMSIVVVDEKGRLTLPRETGIRKTRAVVIPVGSFIVIVPLLLSQAGMLVTGLIPRREKVL